MIKSYKDITGKYLRANKRRTALTLIGIILSISLISAIGFFLKSLQEAQIVEMKNNYGSWHVMYKMVDESLITKIQSNPVVLRSGTYFAGSESKINSSLSVREIYGSGDGLKLMPYKLKDGRFPDTNTETVVEGWFLDKIKPDWKLGDEITILGKKYTLVGVLEDTYRNQSQGIGELLINDPEVNSPDKILLVELIQNRKLQENVDILKKLSDEENVEDNRMLIVAQGQSMPQGIISILVIVIGIVVISTIAVIYNAFQIGVVDRIKQFGLLRAVGSTPRQIRKIILREASILSLIAIPIGIGFGIAALYGINLAFNIIGGGNLNFISPKISLDVIIISMLIGLASIYISAFLPAVAAGRISPLVAISSRNSITKENIKRRKFHLVWKIFGYEGVLAARNIKRNRKRYRITVFSIVISVTLFISFKAFMDMSLKVYSTPNESNNIHFFVGSYDSENKLNEDVIEDINNLPQVAVSYRVFDADYFKAAIDKSREINEVGDIDGIYNNINYNGENKTLVNASMVVYDENALNISKDFLKEGTINIEELNKENGVIIIERNIIYNFKTENSYYGPIVNLKPGDEILLQLDELTSEGNSKYEFGKGKLNKVKVLAILKSDPFNYGGSQSGIKMISTREVAKKLGSNKINPVGLNIKLRDASLESESKRDIENIINASGNLRFINYIDENRKSTATTLMVEILLYGFVIVVSLIGSVNIINTITTNIILRRREFASLKSIGMTQKGLRRMISIEGILYGIVGSFYGAAMGTLLSYMLFRGINEMRELSYRIPIDSILIAALGAIIIGYLSVLAPLRRIKNDNLIEAVREEY